MTVSVVITTYNRKELLKRAIESVLSQTYKPIEVIVTDDGSTDGTFELIKEYKEILYLNYGHSSYYTINRNRGIKRATGELISFLDDDNWWEPTFIEEHVKVHNVPDVAITYSGRLVHIDDMVVSIPLKVYRGETESLNGIVDVGDLMFKKSLIGDGFSEEKDQPQYCSDMKLIDKVLKTHEQMKMVLIPKYLHHYVRHKDAMTEKKLQARKEGGIHHELEEDWKF